MQVPNRIPELVHYSKFNKDKVYAIQRITEYDDGKVESSYIGIFDWNDPNIDEILQKSIENQWYINKQFCEENKYIKPHKYTLRIVEIDMTLKETFSKSDHFGMDHKWKTLKCDNCHGNICYGDPVIKNGNQTFCCYDCLEESGYIQTYSPDESDEDVQNIYDKLFMTESSN